MALICSLLILSTAVLVRAQSFEIGHVSVSSMTGAMQAAQSGSYTFGSMGVGVSFPVSSRLSPYVDASYVPIARGTSAGGMFLDYNTGVRVLLKRRSRFQPHIAGGVGLFSLTDGHWAWASDLTLHVAVGANIYLGRSYGLQWELRYYEPYPYYGISLLRLTGGVFFNFGERWKGEEHRPAPQPRGRPVALCPCPWGLCVCQ